MSSVLIFDGDCSFCRAWIEFWRGLTGDSLEYLPFQEAHERYPDVSLEDCRRAVQLITPEGRFPGADGVCRFIGTVPGYEWIYWLYRRVPGFAALAGLAYRFIANHRSPGYRVTRFLWGGNPQRPTYHTASALFSRALTIIYFIAFLSFGLQVRGLIGSQGILPAHEFIEAVRARLGAVGMWRLPTIFWWGNDDPTLLVVTWSGVALSLISIMTRPLSRWQRIIFAVLWVYYLSIVNAGETFMSFQWDWLLIEAGFIAIFLQPSRPRVWLFQWLLFRLVFESGVVKLASGDPSWHSLTALAYHYETQPLPTPLAWYFNLAPLWFQKISCVFVFAVELVLPWLIFFPRRLKQVAGYGIIALQVLIILTGNYTFFNLLTIALCLFLFDDAFMARGRNAISLPPARANRAVSWALGAAILLLSFVRIPQVAQFGIVNQYGLFAVMTKERPEVQVEGSADGQHWRAYPFRYKPGPLARRPAWITPYQPRLDWQMWFAALGSPRTNPWFVRLMLGLLRGDKEMLSLFGGDPFEGVPPKYVRATIAQYHFTTWDERQKTGNWWKAEIKGLYFPPVGLRPPGTEGK